MAVYDIPAGAKEIKFMVALNDIGSASFNILKDTFYAALPSVKKGDKFNIKIAGTVFFCFIWEKTHESELDNGDFELTISGGGTGSQFKRIVLYPLRDLQRMNTSDRSVMINTCWVIVEDTNVQGIYFNGYNGTNIRNLGCTVGEVWSTLMADAAYRKALRPPITGTGSTDTGGASWVSYEPEPFKFNIGTKYLDILNDMASKGLLFYRQEGQSVALYNPSYTFNSVDINSEKGKMSGYEADESIDDTFNSCLILGNNTVTSYRIATTTTETDYIETEGCITNDMTDNPIAQIQNISNFINNEIITKSINMLITPDEGINPIIDILPGDRLKLDGKLNDNRVLTISVALSDDNETGMATMEMSGDLVRTPNTNPKTIKMMQDINKLKLKTNPDSSYVTAIKQSSDGKTLQVSNSDGSVSNLTITDTEIILDGKTIPLSSL
jgi:hypothetical protein